ncbi:MAG: hypothetical protein H7Y59_07590 [Anaerolineales bacterium]|nr:hypothetical protein [Anaerolineales bacterium]
MLNLSIAMLKTSLIFLLFYMQTADISITSPQPGDILRGQVEIIGNMNVPNFASAELAFSYTPDSAWFTIQTFPQPVESPTMAIWDTASLTDGDYVLHLRVILQDGSSQDVVISDLKIRNDEPLPTDTPLATLPAQFESPLSTSTVQSVTALPTFPSSTPLPANPASVTTSSIYSTFVRGGLTTLVLFLFFSFLLRLRKN